MTDFVQSEDKMKLSDLERLGELHGYIWGFSGTAAEIDGPIAEDTPCLVCGGKCKYRPFMTPGGRSYRAFAVCTVCGEALEF